MREPVRFDGVDGGGDLSETNRIGGAESPTRQEGHEGCRTPSPISLPVMSAAMT